MKNRDRASIICQLWFNQPLIKGCTTISETPPDKSKPEPYELNERDSDVSEPTSSKPGKTRSEESDLYELDETSQDASHDSALEHLADDPRAAGVVDDDETSEDDPPPAEVAAPDKPQPRIHSTAEPKFVDPEVAARRREEARLRAAAESAVQARHRSRRNLLIALGIGAIVLVILLMWAM